MSPRASSQLSTPGLGILAVTGGKGGVGKSNLVVNLGVALARWGRRVLLVDGDLSLANLDVLLGLTPKLNVEQLVCGEASLTDILVDGPEGIRVLPAASGVPDLASLDEDSRATLLKVLAESICLADDVLVDTGAGLGRTALALQLAASRVLIVTTPEPTSLVDSYANLKVLWTADPNKRVDLVVNAARNDEEAARAYEQISKAAEHFLGQKPGWMGVVYDDPRVPEAVRQQRALLELDRDCPAASCYEKIALCLSLSPELKALSMDRWGKQPMHVADRGLLH